MKYRLINKTRIPRDILTSLIDFACPFGVNNFSITIHPNDEGEYYGETHTVRNTVNIWTNRLKKFPTFAYSRQAVKLGYSPNILIKNREEMLVALFAHELRHLWQAHVSKQDFTKGGIRTLNWNGKNHLVNYRMEKDACEYTKSVVELFRKEIQI